MSLVRSLVGFGMSAGITLGGVHAADRAFDAYQNARLYERCEDAGRVEYPDKCPDKIDLDGASDTETGRAWFFGIIGTVAVLGGGILLMDSIGEVFKEDEPLPTPVTTGSPE